MPPRISPRLHGQLLGIVGVVVPLNLKGHTFPTSALNLLNYHVNYLLSKGNKQCLLSHLITLPFTYEVH